ncbi:DUF885 domain-containing protein [Saccharopolyspora erythraea]|uniref:DUF885 domain-containing protein n=1 Tax=Saccharopolyspora erythraea TaxID=1836 RepID=UPI001BAAC94C|nr:DUF885 domain-containing protein [Saccharopolyspora erythraea]QUH00185.1 DUF885 domain-containing protein [Saccharopolyspora erythraea]
MDPSALVTEYVRLGLRFDRLVPGFTDAYTGDPELRRKVRNETRPDPSALAARARGLLAELPGAELGRQREAFLSAQLTALECAGRKLAGEQMSFTAEAAAYFQARITPGDPDDYRRAHHELDEVLPGHGTLGERIKSLRERNRIPPERLRHCVLALSSALRDRVRARFRLPPQETVDYRIVTGEVWGGFNQYLGDFRSRVAINADAGHSAAELPHLIAHESYPGHHTEHCRKEAGLVDRQQRIEHTIFLINTPQCLLAEGIADLGLHAVVGRGWGAWAAEILADLGVVFDGELAERVETAMGRLLAVRQDALVMLHDRGKDETEVVNFLRRWQLLPDSTARRLVRFMADPLWRAYTTTYVEGYKLLRTWLELAPAGTTGGERYRRLLDEPLVPETIREEIAGQIPMFTR